MKRAPARGKVYVKRNGAKLKERMRVSGHPFGTIKWVWRRAVFPVNGVGGRWRRKHRFRQVYVLKRSILVYGGKPGALAMVMEAGYGRRCAYPITP